MAEWPQLPVYAIHKRRSLLDITKPIVASVLTPVGSCDVLMSHEMFFPWQHDVCGCMWAIYTHDAGLDEMDELRAKRKGTKHTCLDMFTLDGVAATSGAIRPGG